MEVLGMGLTMIALFVGFGLLIGILFGFFGMGGSFLVTPALLVMGYEPTVAVGSGLAFVFGTSVIAAFKHRDLGQIDYRVGGLFVVGVTAGIEVGKRGVLLLTDLGLADLIVSVAYVLMLGSVGLFVLRDALSEGDRSVSGDDLPALVTYVRSIRIPPVVSLRGGGEASIVVVLAMAVSIGVLSGFLGVGGGFLLMPALMYGLGVPAAVAVGTDIFQITLSGAFGAFTYAREGAVNLAVVAPLLAGSALGAQLGSAATDIADEEGIKVYFGLMLLGGAVAVAVRQVGGALGMPALNTVSVVLIAGSALLVSGAVVYSSLVAIRRENDGGTGMGAD